MSKRYTYLCRDCGRTAHVEGNCVYCGGTVEPFEEVEESEKGLEKCDKCDYFISVEEAYKSGCSDTVDKIVDIYNSNPEIDAFTLIRNLLKIKDENKFNLNNKNN